MTPVEFQFNYPDGEPIANCEFSVKLAKSGFVSEIDGVVVPYDTLVTTDDAGRAVVALAPSSSPYTVKLVEPSQTDEYETCKRSASYKFYVPVSDETLRAQDLYLNPPPSTTSYDEAALLVIMDSKTATLAAAAQAGESANEALSNSEVATSSKDLAQEAASTAQNSALDATNEASVAASAAEAALLASEQAQNTAGLVKDVAAGLATGAQYFSVLSPDSDKILILYENVNGAAVDTGKRTPSVSLVEDCLEGQIQIAASLIQTQTLITNRFAFK